MGFDVCRVSKVVTVDHSHNRFAVTTVDGNPKKKTYNGLSVIGIFKRNKGAHKRLKKDYPDTKIDGDNSPMLYALKNMDGLTTTTAEVRNLFRNARTILHNEVSTLDISFDHVITVPSSHKLASIVAQMALRTCRKNDHSITHIKDVLRKATGAEVRTQVKEKKLKSKTRSQILSRVNKFIKEHGEDADFQIKYVFSHLRDNVNPLAVSPHYDVDEREVSILLADDMVTSGSSLISARDLLLTLFPNAKIYAVCLFSEP